MILTQQKWVYECNSESEAYNTIEDYKKKQNDEGYTVVDSGVRYKVKKDRKSGEVLEEKWITTVIVSYLV